MEMYSLNYQFSLNQRAVFIDGQLDKLRSLLDEYHVDLESHTEQSGLSMLRFHGFEDVTFAMKRPVDILGTEENPVTHTFTCSRVTWKMTGGGVPASKIVQLHNIFVRLNRRGQDGGFQPIALRIPANGGPLQWPPEGPRTIPCASGIAYSLSWLGT